MLPHITVAISESTSGVGSKGGVSPEERNPLRSLAVYSLASIFSS